MPKIIYGEGGSEQEYTPPRLFPQLPFLYGEERMEYIHDEICRMIEEGTLSITAMLAQPALVRDSVGLALKNQYKCHRTNTHKPSTGQLPPEIAGYLVKVRCCGAAKTVKYKSRVVERTRLARFIAGRSQLGIGTADADGNPDFGEKIAPAVPVWIDYESKEAEIPLPEAWVCMSQHGKYCRPAKSTRLQERYWLYEEVLPEQQKRGPGRPRKAAEA